MMFRLIRFFVLANIKLLSAMLYRFEQKWLPNSHHAIASKKVHVLNSEAHKQERLNELQTPEWHNIKFIIFLNHTSLFEPLFIRFAPFSFLWQLSNNLIVPGADVTMKRPFAGRLLKTIVPGCIPISRKKDETWQQFLSQVTEDKITAILPEGRMMRLGGLDKEGQPMTIRGGFVDILNKLNHGKILFVYSGGLHHIQAPGDKYPRLFKTIKANFELVDIGYYKAQFKHYAKENQKAKMIEDVALRLKNNLPKN